jgi:hypothetical protein
MHTPAAQVFLFLTLNMTATHQQVLERVKEQLKSLIAREDPAAAYAVLCHARLLVSRAPMIFESDYTAFYCRSHDPWCVDGGGVCCSRHGPCDAAVRNDARASLPLYDPHTHTHTRVTPPPQVRQAAQDGDPHAHGVLHQRVRDCR